MTTKITILLLALLVLTVPITLVPNTSTVFASTGMSNCNDDDESNDNPDCNDQRDRVGADDDEVSRDGPDEGSEDANCWGKVTSDFTTTQDGDGGGGQSFGEHSSNPVNDPDTEEEDNETPREGVGNQIEDHPSDHADTVGPRFGSDEDCTQD
jgi:hypothetical protein